MTARSSRETAHPARRNRSSGRARTKRAAQPTPELTNLDKVFWPDEGVTKRDLLKHYADMAKFLLPHIRDWAMVMKRYPNGIPRSIFT